jgi:putative transposase
MKKIYSEEQIVGFVREAEKTEVTIAEFCRQKGFNEGTFCKWKKRFGSMQVAEVKRLRELESENARLKRLVADRMIEIDAMQEMCYGRKDYIHQWGISGSGTLLVKNCKVFIQKRSQDWAQKSSLLDEGGKLESHPQPSL